MPNDPNAKPKDARNSKGAGASDEAASHPEPSDMSTARPSDQNQASARAAKLALSFSQTVAALMRDPKFKNLRIADLEWLVLPPVLLGQCSLVHAKSGEKGPFLPAAVALWAKVSAAVDKRLRETLDKPPMLNPSEWASGNIIWLIVLAGDQRALPRFLRQLQESEFKGQTVNLRAYEANGKPTVKTLDPPAA